MKLTVILVTLVLYIVGYFAIQSHSYFKEDPMLAMSQASAPILH